MKNLLLIILLTISNLIYSQTDSTNNNLQIMAKTLAYTINMPRPQVYYQPTPYVNINLRLNNTPGYGKDTKSTFAVILFSGLAFTAASLSNDQYTYNNKSFWEQTPRQVMFCVGVGLTVVGGVGLVKYIK